MAQTTPGASGSERRRRLIWCPSTQTNLEDSNVEYCSDGTPGQLTFFNPILALGDGFRSSQGTDDCLLLVQAVIKH